MNPLAAYRQRLGLSLRRCADELGIDLRSLWRMERGGGCTLETAAKIVLNSDGEVGFADLLATTAPDLRSALTEKGLC